MGAGGGGRGEGAVGRSVRGGGGWAFGALNLSWLSKIGNMPYRLGLMILRSHKNQATGALDDLPQM